jgi:hypothetical protein
MGAVATSQVVLVHDAQLYVEDHGVGPAMVLVHGGLGSGAEWSPTQTRHPPASPSSTSRSRTSIPSPMS